MIRPGSKESQNYDINNQRVHPQPIDESMNQNGNSMDTMIGRIFNNISSLKSAYIQLQEAHTPYDPDKIQEADKFVIEELTKLSELKHAYREKHPKPVAASPQDSRLLSEIQEQQNLLKTYEVMVKKFQSQIQTRDTEITHLQQQIDEAKLRKSKLEKKLKQRGLLNKESEESDEEENYFSIELTPSLFASSVDSAYQSIHDFSKPLINMMKAAGWDLDGAAMRLNLVWFTQEGLTRSLLLNPMFAKECSVGSKKRAFLSRILTSVVPTRLSSINSSQCEPWIRWMS
jgi:hypothetical protein